MAATWERGNTGQRSRIGNYIDPEADMEPWGSCTDNWLHRPEATQPQRKFANPLPLTPSYCALSMLFTDWNRSGTPSLRVSNDREYYKGGREQMWHVDPGKVPALYTEEEGWKYLRIWGMGIASYDLDFDGYPEYFPDQHGRQQAADAGDPAERRQGTGRIQGHCLCQGRDGSQALYGRRLAPLDRLAHGFPGRQQ